MAFRRAFLVLVVASLLAQMPALAARRAPVDRRAPVIKSWFTDRTIVFSSNTKAGTVDLRPTATTEIIGTVTDDLTGVASVTMTFAPCDPADMTSLPVKCTKSTVTAQHPCKAACGTPIRLSCNKTRRSCVWTGYPPFQPGMYLVAVSARDKKGNLGRAKPFRIIVV